jgi:hypothetical protein
MLRRGEWRGFAEGVAPVDIQIFTKIAAVQLVQV